ncbi:MAG: DUF2062 domain-containing protein [Bacillota bacterium]|uniref:DUF2062 domain-containing protein n=1 Tax=Desulfurispora thermophila TaxID=265470 RepID=UPI0003726120|nr:DUF2062 domain-containing protein [Desulfurispora thermophila]
MRDRLKGYWRSAVQKILALSDSPHRVALGVALGLALDFLPVPVISIPLSYLLARMLSISPVAAVVTVVFFKWAVPLFFTLDYMVGRLLLGAHTGGGLPAWQSMPGTGHLHPQYWLGWLGQLGRPFILGAVINATLAFILGYAVVYHLLKCRQRMKSRRLTPSLRTTAGRTRNNTWHGTLARFYLGQQKKVRIRPHRTNLVNHKARL